MTSLHSKPLALKNVTVTDSFWRTEQELVRTAVIPYQWNALNDNVPGAAPSYCMHNFKAAAAQNKRKDTQGKAFVPPKYTFRGFEALPEARPIPTQTSSTASCSKTPTSPSGWRQSAIPSPITRTPHWNRPPTKPSTSCVPPNSTTAIWTPATF